MFVSFPSNINSNRAVIRPIPPLQIRWRIRAKFANFKSSFTQDPSTSMENSFVKFNWSRGVRLCPRTLIVTEFVQYLRYTYIVLKFNNINMNYYATVFIFHVCLYTCSFKV